MYIIGIDVGGTNTDAVLVHSTSHAIVRSIKTPTTKDIHSGVAHALDSLLSPSVNDPTHPPEDIAAVIIGTTTFLNAVLEESDELAKVHVIRLCGPSSREFPPFTDWPLNLESKIKGKTFMVNGGYQFDREALSDVQEKEIREIGLALLKEEPNFINVVISGVFSILDSNQETQCASILASLFKEAKVNYSFTVSNCFWTVGLLERESAAILNACLRPLAYKTIGAFERSLEKFQIPKHRLFLTTNDGTLTSLTRAKNFPIFTFNSGPTNSLRGAYLLTKVPNALVADVGGTSTDVTFLKNGYPRPSSAYIRIAGVRTKFMMPDTFCIGLGGGSLVVFEGGAEKDVSVGPKSVGYNLKKMSKVFGGECLTATDIAVAAGLVELGSIKDMSTLGLTQKKVDLALQHIMKKMEAALDQMKTSKEAVPLILVGGGSVLIPKDAKLEGISEIIRPEHFDVANALGAANAQISANIESVVYLEQESRENAMARLKADLIGKAVKSGAKEGTIETFFDEIPLSYIPGKAIKVSMKAIGDLDFSKLKQSLIEEASEEFIYLGNDYKVGEVRKDEGSYVKLLKEIKDNVEPGLTNRTFEERDGRKEWVLNERDIDYICCGAGILGTGGGGSPYLGNLSLKRKLKEGRKIRVIRLEDLKQEELVSWVAFYGAPLIQIEKLPGGREVKYSLDTLMNGHWKHQNKTLSCLMAVEIGGFNSIIPLVLASELGIPVIDGDFMGRAFTELQMITPFFYDAKKPYPICISDDCMNSFTLNNVKDGCPKRAENLFRHMILKMGCFVGMASDLFDKKELEALLVRNSLTKAWELGRAVHEARLAKKDFVEELEKRNMGRRIFEGKIVDLTRSIDKGFLKGKVHLVGLNNFTKKTMVVEFQNENLIARETNEDKVCFDRAKVPELIAILDVESFEAIMTEDYRYGLRVVVVALPCDPLLMTPQALRRCGPKAFGYDE